MTTDQHRAFARERAAMIYQHHLKTSGGLGANANHISSEISYEETLYRGLLGECAFEDRFGVAVSRTIYEYGDGGVDFSLSLRTDRGLLTFPVNVKAKSVRASWPGLMRSGTHLRVPVHEIRPKTIYVFAIYREPTDDADVLRWDWGRTLIESNQRVVFKNGNGGECFTRLFDDLRELTELQERMEGRSCKSQMSNCR